MFDQWWKTVENNKVGHLDKMESAQKNSLNQELNLRLADRVKPIFDVGVIKTPSDGSNTFYY